MSEHFIWRPNHFTQEEWACLSRNDQIEWWKQQANRHPQSDPLKALALYQSGIITDSEMCCFVFDRLTAENVDGFLRECPDPFLQRLQRVAETFPDDDDDEGWQRVGRIGIATYFPWVTKEEIQEAKRKEDRRLREGVIVFRANQ